MKDVIIDRLSMARRGIILHGMKKENTSYRAATTAELYALERRARTARAEAIAEILKSVYDRAVSALTVKVVRHA
jgi:hypothetical protein